MAEAGETLGENPLPTKVHGFTVDLVRELPDRNNSPGKFVLEPKGNGRIEDEGEIELSLGLSLNGKFGVDPKRTQVKLFRASSMSTSTLNGEENRGQEVQIGVEAPNLIRTCSLPNVMDEELRKRKALQSLRRVEAKKRRMDKLRLSKEGREKVDKVNCCVDNHHVYNNNNNKNCSEQGYVCSSIGDGAMSVLVQGSELGSQGSGSSGISELDTNSIQDSLTNIDAKTPHSKHSQLPETDRKLPGTTNNIRSRQCHVSDHKPPVAPRAVSVMDKHTSVVVAEVEMKKKPVDNLGEKMPFVSTIGKGPNGRRIEGLLYRYQKGEEVKIVCVCHGSVFSPAEFVRHAGGVDVENPLRHIVVSTPPCL